MTEEVPGGVLVALLFGSGDDEPGLEAEKREDVVRPSRLLLLIPVGMVVLLPG